MQVFIKSPPSSAYQMVYHDRSSFPEFEKLFWPQSHHSGVFIIIKGELRQKLHPCLCVRYLLILWRKDSTLSAPTPFLLGGSNFQSQILERGDQEKMRAWGGLKEFPVMDICLRTYYVSFQKNTFENKIWLFDGSISNVDLGPFQPNNQLMFSFVTFWFC